MTFENESVEGMENTDVSQPSSEAPETESTQAAQPAKETQPEQTPFHEHPRFKELVEQKNAALNAQKALEAKLAQLETRFSQPTQPQAPSKEQTEFEALINDLKGIDPRLAAVLEQNMRAAKTAEDLQKKLESFEKTSAEKEQQAMVQAAVSKINQLHEANKVAPEAKQLINDRLDLLYMQGKLDPRNLEAEYKNALDSHNKFIESIKRAERESYVAAKKQDAAVPTSQPKGQPAKAPGKKPAWSKDPEQARQQIVSQFLKNQTAKRDADAV